jgi:hypothetical protein
MVRGPWLIIMVNKPEDKRQKAIRERFQNPNGTRFLVGTPQPVDMELH